MLVITDVEEMRRVAWDARSRGRKLSLVPTMGALHAGHMSLVTIARQHADSVVASIFVNPSQFGPAEDYGRYPRDLQSDIDRLAREGVDVAFTPAVESIYPEGVDGQRISVLPGSLVDHLCGPHRPGHFEGVATIVAKLFNICMPDVAVFGRKDAQQYVILRRMVRDLDFGIEIVGAPTLREPDGLALSSRNRYLNAEEREQAIVLYEAVCAAEKLLRKGELDTRAVVDAMTDRVSRVPLARLQYAEVVDSDSLQATPRLSPETEVIAALAVFFGDTRLIDNVFVVMPRA